jgi:hypothetical protein
MFVEKNAGQEFKNCGLTGDSENGQLRDGRGQYKRFGISPFESAILRVILLLRLCGGTSFVVRRFGARFRTMLRKFVSTALLRFWLGFSALTALSWLVVLVLDGKNPFRSDDPYIVGFLCGGFAGAMGVVYSWVERTCASRICAFMSYCTILLLWGMVLVTLTAEAPEAAEIGRYLALAHVASGAISWPLFGFHIPRSIVVLISGVGVAVLVMYGIVAVRMASM